MRCMSTSRESAVFLVFLIFLPHVIIEHLSAGDALTHRIIWSGFPIGTHLRTGIIFLVEEEVAYKIVAWQILVCALRRSRSVA
jgi:hypothetical protein